MQLSPQTIRKLSWNPDLPALIEPFQEAYRHECGLSGGLSCAGYDVHLGGALSPVLDKDGKQVFNENLLPAKLGKVILPPRTGALGVTLERFNLPNYLAMHYYNKSTLAREFLVACATLGEPGWSGHLTLELYNQTDKAIDLVMGQPIGQVIFLVLDEPSETPYSGKYQNQGAKPVRGIRK